MKVFYTADTGKPYKVSVVSKSEILTSGGPWSVQPYVYINPPASTVADQFTLYANTDKKIIPLYYTFAYNGFTGVNTRVDYSMATPYYFVYQIVQTQVMNGFLGLMAKIIPYTNNQDPLIGFQWNAIDWNETDFLDPTGGIAVKFDTQLVNSLTNSGITFTIPAPDVTPPQQYIYYSITFLYLELE